VSTSIISDVLILDVVPQDIHTLILGKAMTGIQAFAN
jgi:hypothetical protein